jgi:hypothetical protein
MAAHAAVEAAVTVDGGTWLDGGGCDSRIEAPRARWSQLAGLPRHYSSGTAVRKDRADAAEELGDQDGGVALRLGAVDPLPHQRGANPAPSIHYRISAGRICAGQGARPGQERAARVGTSATWGARRTCGSKQRV